MNLTHSTPSIHQEGMWIASQLNFHHAIYNIVWSIEFNGLVPSAQIIQDALHRVVCRHDSLRSVFIMDKTGLIRKIRNRDGVDLVIHSVAQESIADFKKRVEEFGLQRFDIENGPLFRFELVQYPHQKSVLICCFHHLVMDGTSWTLFEREVWHYLNSKDDLLPPPSYTDFITWQKKQSVTELWEEATQYLQEQLKPHPISWELLANQYPVCTPDDSVDGRFESNLSVDCFQNLLRCAEEWDTTPFRIALAAFSTLMGLYSHQEKYLLETTLIGKSHPDFKKTIGLFVNSAYLDVDLIDAPTFKEFLATMSYKLERAIDCQEIPFHFALKHRLTKKPIGVRPFSPISFTKLPSIRKKHNGNLSALAQRHFLNIPRHPLSVYFQQVEESICLTWIFSAANFSQAQIKKLSLQFEDLLNLCLKNPHLSSSLLIPISENEKRQVLGEWNATEYPFPLHKTVHMLFEEQAAKTPDRIAAISGKREFTYAQLDSRAQAYAAILKANGIKAKSFVPLLLKSSLELLIAELAVMKIGAAFAPLDPDWPKERIKTLLGALKASAIVIAKDNKMPTGTTKAIWIDLDFTQPFVLQPLVKVDSEDSLYCIFTSGSTGEPKGAINPHRGIVNRLFAMNELFGSAFEERVLATTPSTADSHIWQYYWPLISGGRVVIPEAQEQGMSDLLQGLIDRHEVTFTDITPSNFQKFTRHLNKFAKKGSLKSLKHILMGGEAIITHDVYVFQDKFPGITIFNTYGPTETAIGTIFFQVPKKKMQSIPIGRPLPNTKAIILNQALQIVPPNILGELHVGGACMGLGYLDNPDASREKFIPNPFSELNCKTLYKTGDLAYYSEEGLIYFIGRIDAQIKLNGNRIEPGEIETILMQQIGIAQAVVTLERDQNQDFILVAYLVFLPSLTPNLQAIKTRLFDLLPIHMVPTLFFQVDSIPELSNGKIDRKSLQHKTKMIMKKPENSLEVPSQFEQKMIEIWRDILGNEVIDANDHFFVDLHCDSLKLILFILSLDKQMKIPLSTQEIYAAPTTKLLAQYILSQHLTLNKSFSV